VAIAGCRRGAHSWRVLVATILLVASGFLLLPGIMQRSRASSYIEAAVAAHRSFLNGSLPLEVQSDLPSVVTARFAGKVPFTFRLPSSPKDLEHQQIYRLTGGRLVNYKNGYAALIAYEMKRQKISLLVSPSKSAVAAGGEEVLSGGYIFAGELKVYVEGEIFQVGAGDCMFLPKGHPHAFLIQSPEIHMLALITPGGLMDAINEMAAPAQKMEIPADDAPTYATSNLEETMKIFEQYGVHLLTQEEIAHQMP
jgi:mannose-6-phosphate isomerase-like protein (cupin superfamily)